MRMFGMGVWRMVMMVMIVIMVMVAVFMIVVMMVVVGIRRFKAAHAGTECIA